MTTPAAIERSQNAMLRSLLAQLLEQNQEAVAHVAPAVWESAYLFNTPIRNGWSDEELAKLLFRAARQLLDGRAELCIFIDGLDEFDGDSHTILSVIRQLLELPDVKLCVSSRPWVEFGDEFDKRPSLRMQELTYPDIKHYVQSHFNENQGFKRLKRREPKYADALTGEIVKKSDGVFLSVRIVVQSLLAGLTNDDRIRDLEDRLQSLPPELDQLHDKILKDVDSDSVYFQHACQYFKLLLVLGGSTRAILLSFADEDREEYSVRLPTRPLNERKRVERIDTIRRRINSRCKGLLEIGRNERVNFLHRTVRDYLRGPEVRGKMENKLEKGNFDPDLQLCSAYLAMVKTSVPRTSSHQAIKDWIRWFGQCMRYAAQTRDEHRVPLIMHSLHRVMRSHSNHFPTNIYEEEFIDTSIFRLSVPFYRYTFPGDAFLNMATRYGVVQYIRLRAEAGALSNVRCEWDKRMLEKDDRLVFNAWRMALILGGRISRGGKVITQGRQLPLLLDACLSGRPDVDVFRILLEQRPDFNSVMKIDEFKIVRKEGPTSRRMVLNTWGLSLLAVVVGVALMNVLAEQTTKGQRSSWEDWTRVLRLFVAHGAKLNEALVTKVADKLRRGITGGVEGVSIMEGKTVYEVLETVVTGNYGAVPSLLPIGFGRQRYRRLGTR
ncbi:hypothetical protein QBC34DRAFT_100502 [Podospora aff. communis PSN243]|uniref:NACHT domain-containing protein n=1 Tax=Podospora aff. communis PSN243 TaxID=3040156 RepID=A0AAV9GL51_9PEZI|nr:hypothetical protein QBC34DRAFT_100502 [Podospora aff. communis PSN243]